jgi:sporulation protein YlmC with PRC-barrel domain
VIGLDPRPEKPLASSASTAKNIIGRRLVLLFEQDVSAMEIIGRRNSAVVQLLLSTPTSKRKDENMKILIASAILAMGLTSSALAAETMSAAPAESWTITNFYKQAVYDPKETKVGDIDDVLVDKAGKVTGLVVGVGGFLGAGEKDVIVPFTAIKPSKKDNKWWLTMDATKDGLKAAPGFTYDKASTTWVPEKK